MPFSVTSAPAAAEVVLSFAVPPGQAATFGFLVKPQDASCADVTVAGSSVCGASPFVVFSWRPPASLVVAASDLLAGAP